MAPRRSAPPIPRLLRGRRHRSSPRRRRPAQSVYRIGPQDVLDISVFKVPELSKTVQVADVGTVNLPLVGEIPAAGRTAQEVEHDLTSKLGAKYLKSPQVTVLVKEYNSQRVTVEGAVKAPGVHAIKGKMSLVQLIAIAGGLDQATYDSTVVVFRQTDGQRRRRGSTLMTLRLGKPMIQGSRRATSSSSARQRSRRPSIPSSKFCRRRASLCLFFDLEAAQFRIAYERLSRQFFAGQPPERSELVPASFRPGRATGFGYGLWGDYAGYRRGGEPGLFVKLLQYWHIVNKRKWMILSILPPLLPRRGAHADADSALYRQRSSADRPQRR